ncbi:hypothetical protein KJ742_02435 [Patescibacteria group bacterium]|nr:hypothetical protein [Patescibacteria group bacterium]MBU1682778.1 hypothetical protein [Patescibacteria group bacterium]
MPEIWLNEVEEGKTYTLKEAFVVHARNGWRIVTIPEGATFEGVFEEMHNNRVCIAALFDSGVEVRAQNYNAVEFPNAEPVTKSQT